ncbi:MULTISPECIES: aldehyde dehydrogenase family protein [Pseudonocardia]|uniref:Sulfoacetaldehyde dehydrogenase n=2 Tax=Pseudonocardia TaxID=1847 RepID=A0A1Y2MNR1_PSEAH|nr:MULTISPECIES: aldehyde dehydrogenase family protein [Pseudonocardia]OSY36880.1 Sulfoacetaldehyde dehydrogenase [Pseudonocardia autotrophica]TDN76870.1 succinate semialdehyde dehydrogenase [Pseudonocardia autotrophica]BBG00872.1 aldehyde dehydrogenase [Pseudonocardia autotrophica]GEC28861.1 aldehyde dehydrogenase [Pseudonocardia saturnea]
MTAGTPVRRAGSWIGGRPVTGAATLPVHEPWTGKLVAEVGLADAEQVEQAVQLAHHARGTLPAVPVHRRADALHRVAAGLLDRTVEVAAAITRESGKPISWSRTEVQRAASTFRWAAEEAVRWSGELQRLDSEPSGEERLALHRRFPRGPVLGITPFNFPVNLAAHKVAPALAVGAPIVLKPAPKTPLSALLLGEILAGSGLPEGAFSVLTVDDDTAAELVADPRMPVVSFTGSGPVGWAIRDAVPRKHVTLELGGNAGVLICPDWSSDTDLRRAARRIAIGANSQGGQSCISVQRVLVDQALHERFLPLLVDEIEHLVVGDPWSPTTTVGPLINRAAAERVKEWIDDAVAGGARVVTGGEVEGVLVSPTVLIDAPPQSRICRDEVFGPVVTVTPVDGVDEGLRALDDSRFGLQAGVFTHDIQTAFRAHRELEVGGVIVGDIPTFRAEQMPYGGVKESGIGREGVRAAMEDYTEPRLLVFSEVSL